MKTALVGYTGFVGSNIAAAHPFDGLYNSKNIKEAFGQ
ncbi:MAG: NAD(P)-dependent oxidoreductase, partial [Oscillospiraceae bacterium]